MTVESEGIEEVDEVLRSSDLSEDDREMWRSRLRSAGGRIRADFVKLFRDDPDALRTFSGILRSAIDSGADSEKLSDILRKEWVRIAQG